MTMMRTTTMMMRAMTGAESYWVVVISDIAARYNI